MQPQVNEFTSRLGSQLMNSSLNIETESQVLRSNNTLRLGLCCQFLKQPIKFRTTTAATLLHMNSVDRRRKLSQLCLANAESLLLALEYCANNGIGCFRINSRILPIYTHPQVGYSVCELPNAETIIGTFRRCGAFAAQHRIRTAFHPDQFVVLNSPRLSVVRQSIAELEYQAEVAEWVGADVINIHAGGAYGDKKRALGSLERNLGRLSDRVLSRLTLENDDTSYTPWDLLPLCRATGIPLVYDVHHHRCRPDGYSTEQTTEAALGTWNREPLFHISSPLQGWQGPRPQRHHDYIDPCDFPPCWRQLNITVEVEAKAKELAVLQLRNDLASRVATFSRRPLSKRSHR